MLDATGSLVKKPTLISKNKTKNILLYEIAIHDKTIKTQYSIQDGAPCPKQVVTDMSLTLLAAVVRSFTQYNNLTNYISVCFQLLFNMHQDPPTCIVRCDVAHIIKLVTTWKPLHLVDKKVKDFIVRTIAQMILSDDVDDIKQLLKCFFWLIYTDNYETDIIRINDDLSNLDDILNLKEDTNKYNYNQPTRTITEIHTIPLLETEDTSEENRDSKAKTNIIGLLKNGNLSEFKSIQLDGENFVLSNTCAFDSIVQILAVAYCDRNEYATFVMKKKK
ncbi:NOF-FB transposable element protein [Aphis craccivora]|uniref:NOF-FB transposable element protein n=1 Tax=Aphis craccivora TaxID=307492 RepID=A0A6G0YBB6_APHCR|nr:NOF-FB transposable element protein [Aphis craccivora]